jgi:hypothetical protein
MPAAHFAAAAKVKSQGGTAFSRAAPPSFPSLKLKFESTAFLSHFMQI